MCTVSIIQRIRTVDTDTGPYRCMHEAARYGTGRGMVSTRCYHTGQAVMAVYGRPIKAAKIKL